MNDIQKYFRYRQSLIDQYRKGDLTKREYLQANYDAVVMDPFRNVDTLEKGLYNYQYYNALAKQMKFISQDLSFDPDRRLEWEERANFYYEKKDRATMKVLKLLDFRGVTAYFVKVKSKILKGKLIEIVMEENNMILHTTSENILKLLREEGVFEETSRQSLIDHYVNQKY